MRFAILLFGLGLSGLATADYFSVLKPVSELRSAGKDYPGVQEFLAGIDDVYDATTEPVETRPLPLNDINSVMVRPGFRVVHDPSLTAGAMVTAPEGTFNLLLLSRKDGRLEPDFSRPVRLRELVEIRVNLHAQGNRHMEIYVLPAPDGRTDLQPDFVTEGPLSFDLLQLRNLPRHRIDIDSRDVIVNHPQATRADLHGQAVRLEFFYGAAAVADPAREIAESNLVAQEVYRTEVGTSVNEKLLRLTGNNGEKSPETPRDTLTARTDSTGTQ